MTAQSKPGISLPCSHFHDVQTCLLCKRMCLDTQRGVVARAKKIGSYQSKASSAKGMRQEEPSLPKHAVCPSNAVSLSFSSRWLAEGGGEAKLAYSTGELTKNTRQKASGQRSLNHCPIYLNSTYTNYWALHPVATVIPIRIFHDVWL